MAKKLTNKLKEFHFSFFNCRQRRQFTFNFPWRDCFQCLNPDWISQAVMGPTPPPHSHATLSSSPETIHYYNARNAFQIWPFGNIICEIKRGVCLPLMGMMCVYIKLHLSIFHIMGPLNLDLLFGFWSFWGPPLHLLLLLASSLCGFCSFPFLGSLFVGILGNANGRQPQWSPHLWEDGLWVLSLSLSL